MANQYTCQMDNCAFQVRSEDQDEVVNMVQEHAQQKHGMAIDRSDVESGMQEV